ncbi:haloacid dehalogenase type II [Myceligenerans pegani]|uniref:Haloacid dehalogenase type II n=1 Tax=Myceligenerans pegani TaxID=2776917 RepID=A0ABR9N1T0_9MICO|nr:haloacid dehalogenase type II [Myceligenerans sp. TRM 65318]MBE1877176.1 haloacid dehalogenase type II [Myceligenerans sp. TRM 65318]MBE3019447.1 haloacid dehalogenase type II [Myceligenerans sp. TRM 65318]
MARRPRVIAFDVIETMFPLEPIRRRLIDAGQPGHVLELFFSRLLRDGFALAAGGGYRPFGDVAAGALRSATGSALDDDAAGAVLAGFAELDPHPDVLPAVRLARDAGVRLVTLTNGSAENTIRLLRRGGVDDDIEQVLSVDDVRRWKPAPEIYRHAVRATGVEPGRLALVAAHAWDVHGAHRAGLATGWVARLDDRFPDVFAAPDVVGHDLVETVEGLLELPID